MNIHMQKAKPINIKKYRILTNSVYKRDMKYIWKYEKYSKLFNLTKCHIKFITAAPSFSK